MIKAEIQNRKHIRYVRIFMVINLFLILMTIIRSFLCISFYDEAYNVAQAYRTIQGNKYLVENWDYLQTGDIFLYPFLFVFHKITGSSEGIILYSRLIFIILQILLSIYIFKILSLQFDRTHVLFAVLIYVSAVSFLSFHMWYDNWESFFRLIGLFLIFYVISSYKNVSHKLSFILIFLAGVSHACMVYAYPTMIIVYLYFLIFLFSYKRKEAKREHNLFVIFYILGALSVFCIFLLYVLKVGVNNLFVFAEANSESGGTLYFYLSSLSETSNRIADFFNNLKEYYLESIIIFAVDVLLCILLRKNKNRILIFCSIMIFGCVILLLENIEQNSCLNNLMTYLSIYSVPLYHLLKKDSKIRERYLNLTMILVISSYVAGLSYFFTATYGPFKFSAGVRSAAILTILLMGEVIREHNKRIGKYIFNSLSTILIAMNVFSLYYSSTDYVVFGDFCSRPYECDTQIKSGIYKGLFETSVQANRFELAEKKLKESIDVNDKTITCGQVAMAFYLMTDLKPNTANLWAPEDIQKLSAYYNMYYGESDIIVLYDEYTWPSFSEFVSQNYQLVDRTEDFSIYHHK